ncbi:MAG: MerR family DNA-binding protein [Sulfuritalea sp.]|jgi:MerR family mercuric resistance operon transcriptional regulator|nr:MerR family DNA-binding protein [Sulfuritalea sp.]
MKISAQTFTIGKLAKNAGVGVETVRYYQRRGLLAEPPAVAGYRRYDAIHLERLSFIRRAQGVGFTLEEIGELLTLNDTRDHRLARSLASEKIQSIEARIEQLGKVADALRHLVRECECGGQDMPCPIIRMALAS